MLDLKTVLVVSFAIASLQAITWFFVWRAWRHLYELRFLGEGFVAIAFGLLLMIVRGAEPAAWDIVLTNIIIKFGLVLLADGLACFLGQPRYRWIGVSLLVFQAVSWSAAVAINPADVAIRIHLSTFVTLAIMSMMCLGLLRDRTQPSLLRWITFGILAEYILASIAQSLIELQLPAPIVATPVLADRHAWYLLQGTMFQIAFFACLLFMVTARLSADLRERNAALSLEVQERRRLEQQLKRSLETERALRNEQSDFMRVVSHEFRTPLAIIRNAVDMLDLVGEHPSRAAQERIAGIRDALGRLFSLIDRFMANDREANFRPELMRVSALVEDLRLHFEMAGGAERLVFSFQEDAPLFADPDMMLTVIVNLIDNALKYSPNHEPIDIGIQRNERGLVISVRDYGIGIPRAELHKVGRRFYRASNTMAGSGTGLGLYTSDKLLAYHGGTLHLLANQDGGTKAIVYLPSSADFSDRMSERLSA